MPTSEDPFHALNPATGEVPAPNLHQTGFTEAEQAMAAAESTFEEHRRCPPADRTAFLEEIAIQIGVLGDHLIDRASAETGLPAARITGGRDRTNGRLRLFAFGVRKGSWVDARFTSVGTAAVLRFARPVTCQAFSDQLFTDALTNADPLGIRRQLYGVLTRDPVQA